MLLMVLAKAVIGISGRTGTGRPAPVKQVRRARGPGDHDHEVQQDGRGDRSRVGVAELVAELPRLRAPRNERQQRDRERAPHERMAEESPHGARCQTTASSVVVATDQPAGGPGSGTKPVTDWTVIGSIASMRSVAPAGRSTDVVTTREVGVAVRRRGQVGGRVAGVESEPASGRSPGPRPASGAGSRGRSVRSRPSGSSASPPGRGHGIPAIALHDLGRAGHPTGGRRHSRRLADQARRRAAPGEHDAIGAIAIGRCARTPGSPRNAAARSDRRSAWL